MTERMMEAVLSMRYQQLEALLRQDVPIDARNKLGQTPVMLACFIPEEEKGYRMFKFLSKKGADVMETDNQGTSVFQHACRQGRERIARWFVREMGVGAADLSGKNKDGRSPLFEAVTSGNASLVRFIVKLMRDRSLGVDTPDNSGITPLIHAHKLGLVDVAAVLEKDGNANPRICDRERHMSANEWAEEAAEKRQRAQALLRERTKEHGKIYNIKTDKWKMHSLSTKKSPSLPDINPPWFPGTVNTKSDLTGVKTCNSGNSRSFTAHNTRKSTSWQSLDTNKETAPVTPSDHTLMIQSMSTAMTMLDLASRTSDKRRFAKTFVSSEFDSAKAREFGNVQLASVSSLLAMYAGQFSSNYRKAAKPPPPEPAPERCVYREKKPSTLAYIMGRGPKRNDRRNSKGSATAGSYKSSGRRNSKLLHVKFSRSRSGSVSSTDSTVIKPGVGRERSGPITETNGSRKSQNKRAPKPLSPSDRDDLGPSVQNQRPELRKEAMIEDNLKLGEHRRLSKISHLELPSEEGANSVRQRLHTTDTLPNIQVTVPTVWYKHPNNV